MLSRRAGPDLQGSKEGWAAALALQEASHHTGCWGGSQEGTHKSAPHIQLAPPSLLRLQDYAEHHGHTGAADALREAISHGYGGGGGGAEVPLHAAAARGDVAEIQRLLQAGADINEADADGDTAIHLAAMNGHHQAVQLLVQVRGPGRGEGCVSEL